MNRKVADRVQVSLYLGREEKGIIESLANRWSTSYSEVVRRLLLEHGKQLIGDFDKSSEV